MSIKPCQEETAHFSHCLSVGHQDQFPLATASRVLRENAYPKAIRHIEMQYHETQHTLSPHCHPDGSSSARHAKSKGDNTTQTSETSGTPPDHTQDTSTAVLVSSRSKQQELESDEHFPFSPSHVGQEQAQHGE
jgi:hypothetical protein